MGTGAKSARNKRKERRRGKVRVRNTYHHDLLELAAALESRHAVQLLGFPWHNSVEFKACVCVVLVTHLHGKRV